MEIRQLKYFIALYEEGSVTRAANRMNVVQPAVSQQLSKLENELGQALFYRTPKGVRPTQAGEEAYHLILPILRDLEYTRQVLEIRKGIIKGHISIGVVSSISNNALSETLRGFNAEYPEVTVRATGGYTQDLLEMVRTAKLDLAIVNTATRLPSFDTIEIITEELAMICSAENSEHFGPTVTLQEIAKEKLVIPSPRHGLRTIIDEAAAQKKIKLMPQMEFDELATIEDFVMNTDFVAILPPIAVHRALNTKPLRHHLIVPHISRKLVCAVSAGRPMSQVAELFVEALRDRMIEVTKDLRTELHG